MPYKIIISDDFDRETVSDKLYKENIESKEEAQLLADYCNNNLAGYSDYYHVVSQDHELWDASKLYN